MKLILSFVLVAASAFAQRAVVGARPGGGFGSRSGFGSVVNPGTGREPAHAPSVVFPGGDSSFAQRLGATVSGYPPYTGAPSGPGFNHGRQGRASIVYYPYAYPVAYPYDPYQQQQPNITYVYPQTSPTVVINQNFVPDTARPAVIQEVESDPSSSDGIRVYQPTRRENPEPVQTTEEPRTYLVALKDHTIYAAFAYWMEGDTLHYVTTQGTHNQVTVDRVDVPLTERLNRERNVPFKLK
jgi:hypothetical protein